MKRIIIPLLLLIASCTERVDIDAPLSEQVDQGEYQRVTMVIPPMMFDEEPMTRIDLDFNKMVFLWSEKDTVGIFPDLGSQIYFSMDKGVGSRIVEFNGGGWALKKASSYYSYFPFVSDFYIDKEAIPINFKGQIQDGNGQGLTSKVSLGDYCFMVAKGVSNEETGGLLFNYEHLQVQFYSVIPVEAGTYTSLDFCTGSSVIPVEGTMNAFTLDKVINDQVKEDHLSIGLKNITFENNSTLIVTSTFPPFDINAQQLTLNLTKSDGTSVTSSVFGRTYVSGMSYQILPNFSVSPSFIEIAGEETFSINITAANSNASYTVTTDEDWLVLNSFPTNGTGVITVTAKQCTSPSRTGYVVISEKVTKNNETITLSNKVKIVQSPSAGLTVGLEDWEKSDIDYGGVAQ